LRIVKIVGGLFILYLAKGAYDNFRRSEDEEEKIESSNQNSLVKATLTNLLSPNPYIFWSIAAGPILLAGWRSSTFHGIGFLLGFYGAFIITTSLLVILFANGRRFGGRFTRSLRGLAAIALLIFGLIQLWTGLLG
jgi:threonine/homoserine/homoserine lactone efflux protein